jgi:hypothetical protein
MRGWKQKRADEKVRAYQELWFSTLRLPWASLVLVPGDARVQVDELARGLVEVGNQQQGRKLEVLYPNLEHLQASKDLAALLHAANARAAEGPQVVVALPPLSAQPAGVAAALAADAVLVCVEQGRTHLKEAKKTVEMIGRDKVSGCVLIES